MTVSQRRFSTGMLLPLLVLGGLMACAILLITRIQAGPGPSRRHSAHVGHDVVVWYRWHPYFGRTVRCEYTEQRATGSVAHIMVRPGEVIVVPAWMLDREVCDAFSLDSPQVTVDALTNLHRLLIDSSLRNALLNGLNAQEVIDEGFAPTNAATGFAPVDHAAGHQKSRRLDGKPARCGGGKPRKAVDGGLRRLGRGDVQ